MDPSSSTPLSKMKKVKRAKRPQRPLGYMSNNNERQKCFVKREETLRKMARELSSKCQVNVCFICFGQHGVTSWPENRQDVEAMIKTYAESKNVVDKFTLSSYLSLQKHKKLDKISKLEEDDSMKMSEYWDKRLEQVPNEMILGALNLVNYKLESANEKIKIARLNERTQLAPQDCPFTSTQQGYYGMLNMGDNTYSSMLHGSEQADYGMINIGNKTYSSILHGPEQVDNGMLGTGNNTYSFLLHGSEIFHQKLGNYGYDMRSNVGTSNYNIFG